jgi:hypothetical protein
MSFLEMVQLIKKYYQENHSIIKLKDLKKEEEMLFEFLNNL